MEKLYLVSQQFYEEFFVYGIFIEGELDHALSILAEKYIKIAEANKEESKKWYKNTHLAWLKTCEWGCEHMPYALSVPIEEYSKSLFKVSELKVNELSEDGIWII